MDAFKRIEEWRQKGVIVEVMSMNQVSNGYGDLVEIGEMPLVTFTGSAVDEWMYDQFMAISTDTFQEAVESILDYLDNNKENVLKEVEEIRKMQNK